MLYTDLKKSVQISAEFQESLYQLPDGDKFKVCIQCGTCSGICPFRNFMEYTPRKVIALLRVGSLDEVLRSDKTWMCVSCYACAELCPQQIPLTSGLMTRLKEELLLAGNIPGELQDALENSQRYGNPMGESPRKRADWTDGVDVPVLGRIRRPVEVLWFVGDYASYHPMVQESTRAMARLLGRLGVDYAILGPEEVSDGDSQRLAGEFGLFEMLAEKNGKSFGKYQFEEIITTDPHAYNAMRNEYPKLGIDYPVRHYTQFLADRLEQIAPLLVQPVVAQVAFHDPCYLGRVNKIYDAPRQLLAAIPGVEIVEMAHTKSFSLCCGGGGGGMWLDGYHWDIAKMRTSDWRVQEMVAAKPIEDFYSTLESDRPGGRQRRGSVKEDKQRILAVACPYEKPRFEDAIKVVKQAKNLRIMEIAEMLVQSMGI